MRRETLMHTVIEKQEKDMKGMERNRQKQRHKG